MAYTRERALAGAEGESGRDLATRTRSRPPRPPADPLAVFFGVLLCLSLSWVYWAERVDLLSGALAAGSAMALVSSWSLIRRWTALRAVLLVNVALFLAYFWSLGEAHHVVITVTAGQVSAAVDGDTTTLRAALPGTAFGFQESPLPSYRIQATGEAIQSDTSSLAGRVASAVRLAGPGTGWSDVRVAVPGRGPSTSAGPLTQSTPGAWGTNRRGELEGAAGSYILFPPVAARTYTISADVIRPDGTQTLVLGVDSAGEGYALQLRFDQPDALWVHWKDGVALGGEGGTALHHLAFVPEVQRILRVLLTGYLFALVFGGLALGLYPVLHLLLRGSGDSTGREWETWKRALKAPAFPRAMFGVISVLGLVVTGLVCTSLLQRMPHVQDSVAYLFQAKIFATGALSVPAPPAAIQGFFTEQFVPMYHGRWFSQYPPGHPIMLAIGVLFGAPWLIDPLLASLSLGMIFLLGRRIYGTGVGIIAGLLGLASPFWLFLGSSFMAHATGLFFFSACLLCLVQTEEVGGAWWPFLAGLCAGMAFITRQLTAVGLLPPFVVYLSIYRRRPWREYLPLVIGALIPLCFYLLYNWVQVGNPLHNTYVAWDPTDGPGFRNATPGGPFTPADGVWNAYQNVSMLSAQLFGWPYGLALAFAVLPFVLGAARRWDYFLLVSFLGVVVAYMFYWGPGLMYGPRYYYEALPALLLLTGRGMVELGRLSLRVWPRFGLPRDPTLAGFVPLVLVAALVLFNLRFYLPAQLRLYDRYNYSSDAELQSVAHAHIHHAIVFVVDDPPGFWSSYGNVFFANDPTLHGDIIYARDEGAKDSTLYRYFPGRSHYRLDQSTLTRIS